MPIIFVSDNKFYIWGDFCENNIDISNPIQKTKVLAKLPWSKMLLDLLMFQFLFLEWHYNNDYTEGKDKVMWN